MISSWNLVIKSHMHVCYIYIHLIVLVFYCFRSNIIVHMLSFQRDISNETYDDTFIYVVENLKEKQPFPGAWGSRSSKGFETSSPRIDERRILLELIWVQRVYQSERIQKSKVCEYKHDGDSHYSGF